MVSGPFPFYGTSSPLPQARRAPGGARRDGSGRDRQAGRARPRRGRRPHHPSRGLPTGRFLRRLAGRDRGLQRGQPAGRRRRGGPPPLRECGRRSAERLGLSGRGDPPLGRDHRHLDERRGAGARRRAARRDRRAASRRSRSLDGLRARSANNLESGGCADGRPPAAIDRRAEGAVPEEELARFCLPGGRRPRTSGTPDPRRARPPAPGGPGPLRRARRPATRSRWRGGPAASSSASAPGGRACGRRPSTR